MQIETEPNEDTDLTIGVAGDRPVGSYISVGGYVGAGAVDGRPGLTLSLSGFYHPTGNEQPGPIFFGEISYEYTIDPVIKPKGPIVPPSSRDQSGYPLVGFYEDGGPKYGVRYSGPSYPGEPGSLDFPSEHGPGPGRTIVPPYAGRDQHDNPYNPNSGAPQVGGTDRGDVAKAVLQSTINHPNYRPSTSPDPFENRGGPTGFNSMPPSNTTQGYGGYGGIPAVNGGLGSGGRGSGGGNSHDSGGNNGGHFMVATLGLASKGRAAKVAAVQFSVHPLVDGNQHPNYLWEATSNPTPSIAQNHRDNRPPTGSGKGGTGRTMVAVAATKSVITTPIA